MVIFILFYFFQVRGGSARSKVEPPLFVYFCLFIYLKFNLPYKFHLGTDSAVFIIIKGRHLPTTT